MRLLNVNTFKLESFPEASKAPAYAILSHRWEDDEVLFQDLQDDALQSLVRELQDSVRDLERRLSTIEGGTSKEGDLELLQRVKRRPFCNDRTVEGRKFRRAKPDPGLHDSHAASRSEPTHTAAQSPDSDMDSQPRTSQVRDRNTVQDTGLCFRLIDMETMPEDNVTPTGPEMPQFQFQLNDGEAVRVQDLTEAGKPQGPVQSLDNEANILGPQSDTVSETPQFRFQLNDDEDASEVSIDYPGPGRLSKTAQSQPNGIQTVLEDVGGKLNEILAIAEDPVGLTHAREPEVSTLPPPRAMRKKGWHKLESCVEKAKSFGFQWVWADTCCIDKKSSSELSEAINSMFTWYRDAKMCIAYLSDVVGHPLRRGVMSPELCKEIGSSAWFERGWTLQELVAPREVWFFSRDWHLLGLRSRLAGIITFRTRINQSVLAEDGLKDLSLFSVATRLSWAAKRITTRPEDRAYSLLGLFGISLPILYGEGGNAAFFRLQSQIFHVSPDHTLLAWQNDDTGLFQNSEMFSSSPDAFITTRFLQSKSYEQLGLAPHTQFTPQNKSSPSKTYSAFSHGMRLQLLMRYTHKNSGGRSVFDACLACRMPSDSRLLGIQVVAIQPGQFKRISSSLIRFEGSDFESGLWFLEDAYIFTPQRSLYPSVSGQVLTSSNIVIDVRCLAKCQFAVDSGSWPAGLKKRRVLKLPSHPSNIARLTMLSDPTFLRDEPTGEEKHIAVLVWIQTEEPVGIILAMIACRLKAAIMKDVRDPKRWTRSVGDLRSYTWQDLSLGIVQQTLAFGGMLFVNAVRQKSARDVGGIADVIVHIGVV